MRLVDRGLARRHGRELWKPRAQGQREECNDFGKCGASAFHGRDDRAPLLRAAARFETWEGSSSSHDPNFSREAAFLFYAKAASPRKWVSGGLRLVAYASESAPTLGCTSAKRFLGIDEVATPVSFTVETTVLPSSRGSAIRKLGVLRFGSHRQPLQSRAGPPGGNPHSGLCGSGRATL